MDGVAAAERNDACTSTRSSATNDTGIKARQAWLAGWLERQLAGLPALPKDCCEKKVPAACNQAWLGCRAHGVGDRSFQVGPHVLRTLELPSWLHLNRLLLKIPTAC